MPVSLNFIKDFLIDDFYDANGATSFISFYRIIDLRSPLLNVFNNFYRSFLYGVEYFIDNFVESFSKTLDDLTL